MAFIVHLLVLRSVILGIHGSHGVEVGQYAMVVRGLDPLIVLLGDIAAIVEL